MGASSIALFARVGGGIYTKAADVGADLVGKVEAGIPEDDPRNPATIADNVGDNVGDVAGLGADIFESYVGAVIATIALAATSIADPRREPVLRGRCCRSCTSHGGLVASLIGIFVMRILAKGRSGQRAPHGDVHRGRPVPRDRVLRHQADAAEHDRPRDGRAMSALGPFWAVLAGTIGASLIGLVTEYYTAGPRSRASPSPRRPDRRRTSSPASPSAWRAAIVPVLLICGAIVRGVQFGRPVRRRDRRRGMLATVGVTMSVDAYGPIADNAGGITEMSPPRPRGPQDHRRARRARQHDGRHRQGLRDRKRALTALAMFSAYASAVGLRHRGLNLIDPMVVIGLFIGGVMPFFVGAQTMTAVGRAAQGMVEEVRRQFREIPGLLEGTGKPDSARCVDISTKAALRR
jgi:K(+)-stimulated pyrophosphate-energized sodium pump